MSDNLKYFKSIRLPSDPSLHPTFTDIEDILQNEHGPGGKHPVATEAQSGFISAPDFQKLMRMWEWFQDQMKNK